MAEGGTDSVEPEYDPEFEPESAGPDPVSDAEFWGGSGIGGVTEASESSGVS